MRNSILKRTFRYFLISLCAMIIVFATFALTYLNRHYREQYEEAQIFVTEKTAESVNELLMSIKQTAYYLCCNEALAEALINEADVGEINQRRQINEAFVMNLGTPSSSMLQSAYEMLFVDAQFDFTATGSAFNMDHSLGVTRTRIYSARDVQEEAWFRETMAYGAQTYAFTCDKASGQVFFAYHLRNIHLTDPRYSDSAGVVLYSVPMDTVSGILRNDQMAEDSVSLLLFNGRVLASTNEKLFPCGAGQEEIPLLSMRPDTGRIDKTEHEGESYELSTQEISNRWRVVVLTPSANMRQSMMQMMPLLGTFSMILIAMSLLIAVMFSRRLSAPILKLSEAMVHARKAQQLPQKIPVVRSGDEIEYLYHSYNEIVENIHRISQLEREQNAKLQKSELKALQSQINPHFVYNTLDSVACIALLNGEEDIATMVASLINILKYSIRFSSMKVRLREEIDYLKQYIHIQNLRYRDRFTFECSIPEEYSDVTVPRLMIQPLVENALFYAENEQMLKIRVYCEEKDGCFFIHVCDNGSGADVQLLNERVTANPTGEKYGIGIGNVNKRIQLMAGAEYGLHYEQLPDGGLDAIIVLPYEKMD